MANNRNRVGLFALILALTVGFAAPAMAEFFGCKDTRGQVLYTYGGSPDQYSSRGYSRRTTREYAAQPSRRRYSNQRVTSYSTRRYSNDRSQW
jgi:hypothetical protein